MKKARAYRPALALFWMLCWGASTALFSQQKTVSGNITDENGLPLPGATVIEQGTNNGTTTDFDGNFSIEVSESAVLEVSFIGYMKKQIVASESDNHQIHLNPDNQLEEVIVTTGVAVGTATRNLGFSVAKVSLQEIEQVPAADPGNALRGKVPGIRVVQPSGNPTSAPQIRLRGSTSISGSQSPLYIVDGNITNGSSRDIPVEDIDAIEIVKGAAASSLYGSLAGNGVVQIITKKGKRNQAPLFTLRQEVGFSSVNGEYPLTNKHPYKTAALAMGDWDKNPDTPDTSNFGFDLSSGNRVLDTDADGNSYFKNNYESEVYDNAKNIYTEQPFSSTNLSFTSGGENFNTYASFHALSQGGILEPVDAFTRRSIRLNHEQDFSEKLKLSFSTNYVNTNGINLAEQGQGANVFYSTLVAEPFINLKEKHADGYFSPVPNGYTVQGSNFQNPLYVVDVAQFNFGNKRFLAGANAEYKLIDNLTLNARQSIDKNSISYLNSYPKGFVTPTPNATLNNGFLSENKVESEALISSLGFTYKFDLENLNVALTGKYLFEKRSLSSVTASGYNFIAEGVMNLENTLTENQRVFSQFEEEIAKNYFLNVDLNYKEKFIVSGLVRNDESSLFGKENRSRIYGRGAVAYILSEDLELEGIDFLKVRASYGTSGLRPMWAAQYETFSVTASSITPGILGNKNLSPSVTSELEVGLNVSFLNNFSFEFNYSKTNTKDDFLLVPLPSVAGYTAQWKNIGGLESTYLEAGLRGEFLEGDGLRWKFNLAFDTGNQVISDLGSVPPFTRSGLGAVDIFRVEENKPYGTLYGYKYAKSLDELSEVNGGVVNVPASGSSSAGGAISDYQVNEFGYVVRKEDIGTPKEAPLMIYDEDKKNTAVTEIGNTNPNFNIGFSSTLYYKDLSLYFLLDYQNGGDIYNYTKQLLYFNERHKDLEVFGASKKEQNYAQNIYNRSDANSHFVEDGSYTKIREISLAYSIGSSDLGALGKSIKQIKFQLTGRNLFTFTNYSGWDPEVAISTNPTNFRLDEYSYPNFRTYSAALTLKF